MKSDTMRKAENKGKRLPPWMRRNAYESKEVIALKKIMEAIRQIKKVKNHQVSIDLPETYENEEVEVIILPVFNQKINESFSDLLLKGPVWTEKEVKTFKENLLKGYAN